MIIKIESAEPTLSRNYNTQDYSYYVKFWRVKGFHWDGDCMCTKKTFDLFLNVDNLHFKKDTLIDLVKARLVDGE
jgi:hypothetical protein